MALRAKRSLTKGEAWRTGPPQHRLMGKLSPFCLRSNDDGMADNTDEGVGIHFSDKDMPDLGETTEMDGFGMGIDGTLAEAAQVIGINFQADSVMSMGIDDEISSGAGYRFSQGNRSAPV